VDINSRRPKLLKSLACDCWIRISHGSKDALDARANYRITAGSCASGVAAGLEIDVHRCAAGTVAGSFER
jgi:hypothetical protein